MTHLSATVVTLKLEELEEFVVPPFTASGALSLPAATFCNGTAIQFKYELVPLVCVATTFWAEPVVGFINNHTEDQLLVPLMP